MVRLNQFCLGIFFNIYIFLRARLHPHHNCSVSSIFEFYGSIPDLFMPNQPYQPAQFLRSTIGERILILW